MPTLDPPYQPSRANCMRKTCAKAVETVGRHGGSFTHIPTPATPNIVNTRVQTRFSPHCPHSPSTVYPHTIIAKLPLLWAPLSPLSTGPITTTTTLIN